VLSFLFAICLTVAGMQLLGCSVSPCGADINWQDAAGRVGDKLTVSGTVEGAAFKPDVSGAPTFLNLGNDYPNPHRVTVLIWGDDRSSFTEPPESAFRGNDITVTGEISKYQGVPEIEVTNPGQIGTC
jgi:DNA/RNA endonuclease YhcR with UshA esterase domain